MAHRKVGDQAPEFQLLGSDGSEHSLKRYAGRKVVLYFYPQDDTPGCTREACDFRDYHSVIQANDAVILGVSADSHISHEKFAKKYDLDFVLLSDETKSMISAYGALNEKGGIQRMTYVINEEGRIAKVYPSVRVEGHVEEIIADLPLLKG